jgi:26S proteasome regulatory subunit N1
MTAVPKPLKFLRPHYDDLTGLYENWAAGPEKVGLAAVPLVVKLY